MRRVLVTGASGFVGRHTLPLLVDAGFDVHAVSRGPAVTEHVNWHQADLLEVDTPARLVSEIEPSHLLHLAWFTEPGAYWTSVDNVRWLEASLRLIRAFAAEGRRAVIAGSCAEYDWSHGVCSEERTPLRPDSLYGTCKNSLRAVLERLAVEAGFSAAWGRIFYLYGPGEHPERLVPSVIRSLLRGEPVGCTSGRQIRDYLHVADAASAFVRLLDGEVVGAVNIASGEPVAVRRLLLTIGEIIGAPELLRFGEVEMRVNEPPLLVADVRRIFQEVGCCATHDLQSGLLDTVRWWSRHEAALVPKRTSATPIDAEGSEAAASPPLQ